MQIKVIIYLLFIFILHSCSKIDKSVGSNNLITIFSSSEDRELVELYLKPIFNKQVMTPIYENLYDVKILKSSEFIIKNKFKNIIIASIDNPADSTGDILVDKFTDVYKENILSFNNLYADNQLLICIEALNIEDFSNIINFNNNWIIDSINENIFNNYYLDLIINEPEESIVELIRDKFNIEIFIDNNYKIIKNNDNFLWIGRGHPYRWLVIYETNNNQIEDYKAQIINVFENNLTGITIPPDFLNFNFERNVKVIRGLYEHFDSDTGGPFFTYIFDNNVNNNVILLSGFVNNPGKKKSDLLLQLETIINKVKVKKNE
tara:strand:+ start:295 stop:1251 length:957 start_codon:yes stop_codon:yes gene_type:complete